jgi:hypothetical protein
MLVAACGVCAHRFNDANSHRRFPITIVHVDINPITSRYNHDSTHGHFHAYCGSDPNSPSNSNTTVIPVRGHTL